MYFSRKIFSDSFNIAIFTKFFRFWTYLVGAAIAPHGINYNADFSMLMYIPMEFSPTHNRELVEPFSFELGLVTNMAIKDEIPVSKH